MSAPFPAAAMRELFIYYRVRQGLEGTALSFVQTMQRDLRQRFPQLQTRLLCRPPSAGSAQTWMETYAMRTGSANGGGIDTALERAIEAHAAALAPYIDGERHVELFVPVANGAEGRHAREG